MAESVVAIVTRKGNPKKIKDWADLTRCGNCLQAGDLDLNFKVIIKCPQGRKSSYQVYNMQASTSKGQRCLLWLQA